MSIVQILLLIIIVFMLVKAWRGLVKNKLHFADFLLWLIFWSIVATFVIWPQITQFIADKVGVGRGVDLIIYLALLASFFLHYNLILKVKQLDRKITVLGREIALSNAKDETEKIKD